MNIAKEITRLRESVGENRRQFSDHTGIPVRTLEDWEAGRRTPPEYLPRLIAYQLAYEKLAGGQGEVVEPSTVVVEDPTPTPAPGSESSDANMEVYLL